MKVHVGDTPKAFVATFWIFCAIHIGGIAAAFRLPVRAEKPETDQFLRTVKALAE
jgi:hypothetical protein